MSDVDHPIEGSILERARPRPSSTSLSSVRIFVSSPGDVIPERLVARDVIQRLDREFSSRFRVNGVFWEQEPLLATEHFQTGIVSPAEVDIVVGILWSRLGSPLPSSEFIGPISGGTVTGTEYEWETALRGWRERRWPKVIFFRKVADAAVKVADRQKRRLMNQQLEMLDDFIGRWFEEKATGSYKAALREFRTTDEFRELVYVQLEKLLRELSTSSRPGANVAIAWRKGNPFRGLESFDVEHAQIFFGRTRARNELREALVRRAEDDCAFLIVVGASGSGKSSLVKAGLVPDLATPGLVEGVGLCRHAILRPGDERGCLHALASALVADTALPELVAAGYDGRRLAAVLLSGDAEAFLVPIREALRRAARERGVIEGAGARLAVVVDQLEEIFTNDLSKDERERFMWVLEKLATSGVVFVVATLRSDFLTRLEGTARLAVLAGGYGSWALRPPSGGEVGDMIRLPAEAAGLQFDVDLQTGARLDEVLRTEAEEDPSTLPLLEYMLDQLWTRRTDSGLLTFNAHQELGGLPGVVGRRADEVFGSLPEPVRAELPRLLRALVTVTSGDNGVMPEEGSISITARRAPWTGFPAGTPRRALVDAFLDPSARLLVADDTGVRVAHESLLVGWERAADQLRKDRRDLETRARIERDHRVWNENNKDETLLLPPGVRLNEAQDLVQRRAEDLTAEVLEYVTASATLRLRREEEERERRDRELAQARALADEQRQRADVERRRADDRDRNAKRQRRMIRGLAALLLILAGTSASLAYQRNATERALAANDFREGTRWAEAGDSNKALAFLASAMRLDPGNASIRTALVNRMRGIMLPLTVIQLDRGVSSAAFSADGKRIVTVSAGGTMQVWDARTGAAVGPSFANDHVTSAAFSPDGARVLTDDHGTVEVRDAVTGVALGPQWARGCRILPCWSHAAPEFSSDGTRVVSFDAGTVQVWDAQSGAAVGPPLQHDAVVNSASFSADGTRVATATSIFRLDRKRDSGGTVQVWNARTGTPWGPAIKHDAGVNSAVISADGTRVLTTSGRAAQIWDVISATALGPRLPHDHDVNSAVFSPDGTRVLTVSRDGTARIWDARSGSPIAPPLQHDLDVVSGEFSRDGTRVLTASHDRSARIWDARSGAALGPPLAHEDEVNSAKFSADGTRVVTASSDGTARIWDARTGALLAPPLALPLQHESDVTSARFSSDGELVVTVSLDRAARIWDARSGAPVGRPLRHEDKVASAKFSADGKRVVTISSDRTMQVWDARSGAALGVLRRANEIDTGEVVGPDEWRLLTLGADKAVRVWDTRIPAMVGTPLQHEAPITTAAFSRDWTRVVTASHDGSVRIWDASSGAASGPPFRHEKKVNSARFSDDGTRVVTASSDHTARVWDVDINASHGDVAWLADAAEALSARKINEARAVLAVRGASTRLAQLRRELASASDRGSARFFVRWLLDDSWQRTVSPYSTMTVHEYVSGRLKTCTPAARREVERAFPGNPLLRDTQRLCAEEREH